MFRLENIFWERLENKYKKKPVVSNITQKPLKFSTQNLIQSLNDYINNALININAELYYTLKHRHKNVGYKKDNIYRLFRTDNPEWNPKKELVDLLCYYAFDMSYEEAVNKGFLVNNIEKFRLLKSERAVAETEQQLLADKIENKLLVYHQKKIDFVINQSVYFDVELESFDKNDLKVLKTLQPLRDSLGEIHWDIIENRFFVNPNIVRGLKLISELDNYIVGFFIMYPITKACKTKIEKGEMIKSDDFGLSDICKDFNLCQAIYVSLVFAVDRLSKAFLLLKLKEELLSIIFKYPNIKTIYVRPVSDDGLRNVERHKFSKMKGSPTLYYQETKNLLSLG